MGVDRSEWGLAGMSGVTALALLCGTNQDPQGSRPQYCFPSPTSSQGPVLLSVVLGHLPEDGVGTGIGIFSLGLSGE